MARRFRGTVLAVGFAGDRVQVRSDAGIHAAGGQRIRRGEVGVPTPSTAAALYARQTSRGGADDILRVVSTMRAQFGGHVTKIDEIATH